MAVNVLKICTVFLLEVAGTVAGDCLQLPEIRNSGNNVTGISVYLEDTAVKFHCLPVYRPEGNDIYRCSGGKWMGGPFSCSPRFCPPLGSPDHGKKLGDNYEVGAVVRYKCNTGYELAGSSTYQCQSNEKWQPSSIPKCHIKKCGTAPSVAHGYVTIDHTVNGQEDVYGAVLKVQCNGNFIRSGPAKIYCNKNGQWTEKPKCEPVSCPPYPGLDSECILKSKLEADNTLLFIYCTENSTPKDSETASCVNNKWDDLSVGCLCDCAVKSTSDLVQLENLKSNGMLTHGETLKWHCKEGSINATAESFTCDNGVIGRPVCKPNVTNVTDTENIEETAIATSGNILVVVLLVTVTVLVVCVLLGLFVARKKACKNGRCKWSKAEDRSLKKVTDEKSGKCLLRRETENKDDQRKGFDNVDIEWKPRTYFTHEEIELKGEANDHRDLQPTAENIVDETKKKLKAEVKETDTMFSHATSNEFQDEPTGTNIIDLRCSSYQHKDTNKEERKTRGRPEIHIKGLSEGAEHVLGSNLPPPSLPNNKVQFCHKNEKSSSLLIQAKENNKNHNSGTIPKKIDLSTVKHMPNVSGKPKDILQPEVVSVNLQQHVNTSPSAKLSCDALDVPSTVTASNDSKKQEGIPDSFKDTTKNSHCYQTLESEAENTKEHDRFISDLDPVYGTEIN